MITSKDVAGPPLVPEEPPMRAKLIHKDGTGSDYGPVPASRKEVSIPSDKGLRVHKDTGKTDGMYRIFKEV